MTEKAKSKVKVLVKRSIWLQDGKGAKKVAKGKVVELSAEEVKHFGAAVTRDVPDAGEE